MRKRGPCLHCGITFDLHWRQGPKDKPVLCNSCGIRYKNWGNLENYSPRHCPQIHNNNLQVEKDEEDPSSNDQDSESDNDTKVHDDRPQNNVDLSQPQKTVKRTRSKRRMTTAKLLGNYKK
ncbi:GATA-type zinc finger protein 1 [Trifolium repens]|nr:GATA-type zinc finger protein 1 [Trifolium repens]